MANPNFIKPEALRRLPPGFRFHPTDEELVLQYLKRKAFSFPLPAAFIPEIDLGKYGPWELPGVGEQERYFFYQRAAKYPNGGRVNRAIGSGHWKAAGKDKPIFASKSKEVIGMKKVLVFYHGKPSVGSRTNWVMHEYRLAGAGTGTGDGFCSFGKKNKLVHSTAHSRNDWVLCRIYMKKRSAAEDDGEGEGNNQQRERVLRLFNFMKEHEGAESLSSTSSSSSDLSCVTDLSDRMTDDSDEEK